MENGGNSSGAGLQKQDSVLGGGFIPPLVSPPYPHLKGDEQFQSEVVECE